MIRKLQTGARIGIITTDDNVPYTFVVANATASMTTFTVESAGWRELIFTSLTPATNANMFLLGAQYEISSLDVGSNYFVRSSAVNSVGICHPDSNFFVECGGYVSSLPQSLVVRGSPTAPTGLVTTVVDFQRIQIAWLAPETVGKLVSYRVDAFTQSSKASLFSSFFGDSDVQLISSSNSPNLIGTFTVAFDNFTIQLPGFVNAFSKMRYFNTTADLTSFLEPGDQVLVAGSVYTVTRNSYISPFQFHH